MTWALLPVKALSSAKSRLAGVLTGAQRAGLAGIMLREILAVLRRSGKIRALTFDSPP